MKSIRGRLGKAADEVVSYSASIAYDRRLYHYDIAGSIAHARMLARQKIIAAKEVQAIVGGLKEIGAEIERGDFPFKPEMEDIHMNIESRLAEKIGEAAGKLHTARSRNDQVALDLRIFIKDIIRQTVGRIRKMQAALLDLAGDNRRVVMAGYTHLQPAQPVLFAHHLLAYFEMLERDAGRFEDAYRRADVMPLGSGALAGVPYPVDRQSVADELGFGRISANSLDAVADRDFVIEFQAAASICMMHLSRLAEELVLWSSAEFDFIEIDAAYTTGSSLMPQKKNPDTAELARGKTGRVYGNLMAILTVMKGLPLAYNRDMQEDKEGLFDTADTLLATLGIMADTLGSLKVKAKNTGRAVARGYMLATDLADYLVKKGEPFRKAHDIVSRLVGYAVVKGKTFDRLTLAEYRRFSRRFDKDVYSVNVASALTARDVPGGTAPKQVAKALASAKRKLGKASRQGQKGGAV
ncbi:MAG: argininosuccinate lyase [Dehalococcoidia bacterium]|nr:MAG: argininosuccinate lyase [Dehalococcoidia bacterium]